jgi:hypothetical protein
VFICVHLWFPCLGGPENGDGEADRGESAERSKRRREDAEGKAISCLNARKHGIFAAALTEHDGEGLRELMDELTEELKPVGTVERLLVDKLAVTYLRMQRCARAETLHYQWRWKSSILGRPGDFAYDETVVSIGLYDARLTHQFLRLLREIKARQQARLAQPPEVVQSAQALPAPEAGDPPAPVAQLKNEPNSPVSGVQPPAVVQPAQAAPAPEDGAQPAPVAQLQNEPNSPVSGAQPPASVQSPQAGPPEPKTNEVPGNPPVPQVKNEPNSAGVAQTGINPHFSPGMPAMLGEPESHSSCRVEDIRAFREPTTE